jgi:predicted transcriptional regulator
MIGQGLTNKEIASQLNLSEQTVKNHVHRMLRKVGASDRLTAVEICRGTLGSCVSTAAFPGAEARGYDRVATPALALAGHILPTQSSSSSRADSESASSQNRL